MGRPKRTTKDFDQAIDRLAGLLDFGHLLASMSGASLLESASDEIERLREAVQAVPVEGAEEDQAAGDPGMNATCKKHGAQVVRVCEGCLYEVGFKGNISAAFPVGLHVSHFDSAAPPAEEGERCKPECDKCANADHCYDVGKLALCDNYEYDPERDCRNASAPLCLGMASGCVRKCAGWWRCICGRKASLVAQCCSRCYMVPPDVETRRRVGAGEQVCLEVVRATMHTAVAPLTRYCGKGLPCPDHLATPEQEGVREGTWTVEDDHAEGWDCSEHGHWPHGQERCPVLVDGALCGATRPQTEEGESHG